MPSPFSFPFSIPPRLAFLEQPIPQKGDDGLEAVLGADLEDFLPQLGRGTDGLEPDRYCGGCGVLLEWWGFWGFGLMEMEDGDWGGRGGKRGKCY